jgi:formamidopyrimidine-DNA glycosylase
VETVRAGLERLVGQTINNIEIFDPRVVRTELPLAGREITAVRRRGKYLWFAFRDGDALLAHLGMSGQFRIGGQSKHERVRLDVGGQTLSFADQRMFGKLAFSPGGAAGPAEISHIALDLFDPALDVAQLAAKIRSKRSAVKRVLLDQSTVSGIGNIYADEALWRSRLHYARPASGLSTAKIRELLRAAKAVMAEALEVGGTSFDALYVSVVGEAGYFERSLAAYGREGLPCPRCSRPIVREPFMGRSSFLCRKCQRPQ